MSDDYTQMFPSSLGTPPSFDIDKAYSFEITVTDAAGVSATAYSQIVPGRANFHLAGSKYGVAIGGFSKGTQAAPLFECEYPAVFYNGQRPDWEGKWIQPTAYKKRAVNNYRRAFALDAVPENACLYLAGIGYHKAYLNGQPVDTAVMDPAHTNYAHTVCYAVLPDVAALLKTGDNLLTVQVADGWRSNDSTFINSMLSGVRDVEFDGTPMLTAVLEWKDAAGTHRLVTDESWQWKPDAIVMANVFDGATYDANAADPVWLCPDS
jgi:hypothetical protein